MNYEIYYGYGAAFKYSLTTSSLHDTTKIHSKQVNIDLKTQQQCLQQMHIISTNSIH